MGTRSKRSERCPRCRLHLAHCLCDLVPTIETTTRVLVLQHRRERTKTTATAHLAAMALPHLELRERGWPDTPLDLSDLRDEARRPLLLFPGPDSEILTRALVERDPRPVTLVVPDGSWGQAARMPRREPGLSTVPRVTLPPGGSSRYQLRREPIAGGLATLEAISRALGIVEGPQVQAPLDALFHEFVRRTLVMRGQPIH